MVNKYLIYFFLILIFGASCFSAYKVIRHYDLYANDPLVYGARAYDLQYCQCYKTDGGLINFDQEKVTTIIHFKPANPIIYEELNVSKIKI